MVLNRITFEVAGWLNRTKNNDPFIGLSLSLKGERDAEKIPISLWRKKNRQTSLDAHFRGKESVGGRPYKFSAWLGVSDGLRTLRIEAEELSDSDLSDAARESRARIDAVIREIEATILETRPAQFADPELETEPDSIPF